MECTGCGAVYPILGGIPVLVPSPEDWCAIYQDAALATLAEYGRADEASVQTLLALAERGHGEPMRFGDDWVDGSCDPPGDAPATQHLRALLDSAEGPHALLRSWCEGHGRVFELGPGSGSETASLEDRVVGDLSLRAVMKSGVPGVVCDAHALPLNAEVLLAANVFDLLEEPHRLFAAAPDRVALCTPEPSGLHEVLRDCGYRTLETADTPWLRVHDDRYVQVYVAHCVLAQR